MPFKQPALPGILADASWQKKKGAVAKIAGKTGLGSALKKVESAYGKVNWKALNVGESMPQGKAATRQALDGVFKAAQDEFSKNIENGLRKELITARDLAQKIEADWSKKKLIPKDSVTAAKNVAKEADQFMVALNKNSLLQQVAADYKGFLTDMMAKEKVLAENSKKLKLYCVAVAKGLNSIKTAAEFNGKFWDENIRGVGTTLPLVSVALGIVPEHKTWRTFASDGFKPRSDEEVDAKMKQMAPVLKKIAAAAATL